MNSMLQIHKYLKKSSISVSLYQALKFNITPTSGQMLFLRGFKRVIIIAKNSWLKNILNCRIVRVRKDNKYKVKLFFFLVVNTAIFTTKPCREVAHLYTFIIQVILVLSEFTFFIDATKKIIGLNFLIYLRKIPVI